MEYPSPLEEESHVLPDIGRYLGISQPHQVSPKYVYPLKSPRSLLNAAAPLGAYFADRTICFLWPLQLLILGSALIVVYGSANVRRIDFEALSTMQIPVSTLAQKSGRFRANNREEKESHK